MAEEPKKISFGFSKISKKPAMIVPQKKEEKDFQFIESLEGNSIKLVNGEEKEKGPLVIPLKNANILRDNMIETLKQRKEERILKKATVNNDENGKEEVPEEKPLTLDELAAKEILEDLKSKQEETVTPTIQEIPTSNITSLGEKESTLEDYENVPVQDFGLAVLRGMGWTPDKGIGKNGQIIQPAEPMLRPKGMGLGADKVMRTTIVTSSNEELVMKKNAMLKIVNGPYKNLYGKIEGFDELPGRLMVRLTIQNTVISISENLVQLVPSSEYNKFSKILNLNDYNEFNEKKETQDEKNKPSNEDIFKQEPSNDKYEKNNKEERSPSPRRYAEHTKPKHRSPSSDSIYNRERVKIKKQKSKRSNSESGDDRSVQRGKPSPSEEYRRFRKDKHRSQSSVEQNKKSKKRNKKDSSDDSESYTQYRKQKKRSPSLSSDSEEERCCKKKKEKKKKPPESSYSEEERYRKKKKEKKKKPSESSDSEEERSKRRKEKNRKSSESSDSEEERYKKRKKEKKRSRSSSNESEKRYKKLHKSRQRTQSSDSDEEHTKKKQKLRSNSDDRKKKYRKQKAYKNSSDSSESEIDLKRKCSKHKVNKKTRKNEDNSDSSPERSSKHKRSHNQEKYRTRSRSPSKKKKKKEILRK